MTPRDLGGAPTLPQRCTRLILSVYLLDPGEVLLCPVEGGTDVGVAPAVLHPLDVRRDVPGGRLLVHEELLLDLVRVLHHGNAVLRGGNRK